MAVALHSARGRANLTATRWASRADRNTIFDAVRRSCRHGRCMRAPLARLSAFHIPALTVAITWLTATSVIASQRSGDGASHSMWRQLPLPCFRLNFLSTTAWCSTPCSFFPTDLSRQVQGRQKLVQRTKTSPFSLMEWTDQYVRRLWLSGLIVVPNGELNVRVDRKQCIRVSTRSQHRSLVILLDS